MKVFFDTTVLVAASTATHPHYAQAFPPLRRVFTSQDQGFISAHSLAEVYSVLTRLPLVPRIHPAEAELFITNNILPHFEAVTLSKTDYVEVLGLAKNGGWLGGKIYNALVLRCTAKCSADRIYTFNVVDFRILAPGGLAAKICAP